MTPTEARVLVAAEPRRWRAAFVEAPGTPLGVHPETRVRLHPTVGAAYDELRARKESLVSQGYSVMRGSLGRGVLVLERDGDVRCIGLDKPKRRAGVIKSPTQPRLDAS